jgi:hypothetical protein
MAAVQPGALAPDPDVTNKQTNKKYIQKFGWEFRKERLGIPRCNLADDIKMDLKEIRCQFVDWSRLMCLGLRSCDGLYTR